MYRNKIVTKRIHISIWFYESKYSSDSWWIRKLWGRWSLFIFGSRILWSANAATRSLNTIKVKCRVINSDTARFKKELNHVCLFDVKPITLFGSVNSIFFCKIKSNYPMNILKTIFLKTKQECMYALKK